MGTFFGATSRRLNLENKLMTRRALAILLIAIPLVHASIGAEWKNLASTSFKSWKTFMDAEPSVRSVFERSVFKSEGHAAVSAIDYAEKCLDLCHVGSNNFCSASQSCLMSGFFKTQSAGQPGCTTQTCLETKMCANVDMQTMSKCNDVSKKWSNLLGTVRNSGESYAVKRKMAMFGHGLLGCWRSTNETWSLGDYIANIDSYMNTVNVLDETTGLWAMYKKITQQSLVWEWILALVKAKCDKATKSPKRAEDQQTVVCGSGARGGMKVEGGATEQFCFLPGTKKVANCTSDCPFSELKTCLGNMLDDKHFCVRGSACCAAVTGTEEYADTELDMDILDLTEPAPLVNLAVNSQYGGGAEC